VRFPTLRLGKTVQKKEGVLKTMIVIFGTRDGEKSERRDQMTIR
jgi:hypothetical protein